MSRSKYKPDDPVTAIPLVGPQYREKLERLGISTVTDLVFHTPFRYDDTRNINSIAELIQNREGTIQGTIDTIRNIRSRGGRWLTRATVSDASGSINILWFNQPYLTKALHSGTLCLFNGKLGEKGGAPTLLNPQYEGISITGSVEREKPFDPTHLAKLTPVYPETFGVSSKWLRARIKTLKPHISEIVTEYIPQKIRTEEDVIDLPSALSLIHFPSDPEDITKARSRLGLDELVEIRLQAYDMTKARNEKTAPTVDQTICETVTKEIAAQLPFSLTSAQKTALAEILADISTDIPMYRLLNGDVGSGKTVVAVLAAVALHASGCTTIIMAPTTILAQQHYESITNLLHILDLPIPVALCTSKRKLAPSNTPSIIIGTHALLYQKPADLPHNIGLVIVDEQHRFGVNQRSLLRDFASGTATAPHYLTMTATPIPRTLTIALFGSTHVSILDEMPPGRIPVKTMVVPAKKRQDAYGWVKEKIQDGDQIFVICPLVEDSEVVEAKAATEEYTRLHTDIFPDLRIGLIHGQLSEEDKSDVLTQFRAHKLDILVATPVIEVGIDIPNATIMLIENAERFGLAQLHQFRGRIGRGDKSSYCLLFQGNPSKEARERLSFFASHSNGFEVAQYDLSRRGPGEVYGLRQSGLLNLRFADITDARQLKKAERIAKCLSDRV